jgi:hypothetical protein
MDFQQPGSESEPAKAIDAETAHTANIVAKGERKAKVKDDKKKKKKSSLAAASEQSVNATPKTPIPMVNNASYTATSTDAKKSKKKNLDKDGDDAQVSTKKRKRDSKIQAVSPSMIHNGHGNGSFVVGAAMLRNLEASMSDIGANFNRFQEASNPPEKLSTKKLKFKRKSAMVDVPEVQEQDKAKNSLIKPVDESTRDKAIKKKKMKKDKKIESKQAPETLVRSSPTEQGDVPAAVSLYVTTPKKTPIPLPQKSYICTNDATESQQRKIDAGRSTTEILVTETPCRRSCEILNDKKTPVLFKDPRSTSGRQKPQKAPTILLSPPVIQDNGMLSSAPSAALLRTSEDICEPSNHLTLTSPNLLRFTQPLPDELKPHPNGYAGSMSSASSKSIKDAFARMGRPSPNSSAEINPFFTSSSRKKNRYEMYREGNLPTFDSAMSALLATIDFTSELEYLIHHLKIRTVNDAAGPLPCLNKVTGCTASKEAAIRLMHTDDNLSTLLLSDSPESLSFTRSVSAALEAEKFLHNAVLARVPVPTGKLEGLYTLYCPKYAATHIDKYGFGHRTLTISRPSGLTSNVYTARLSILPRTTTYSILAFEPPPHASFRQTTLITSAERYEMKLVVLGNGYVLLRADLGLLLRGKKTDMGKSAGGDVGMEFLGVREKDTRGGQAVRWADNITVAGERDGKVNTEGHDVQVPKTAENGVVEVSPGKKKRGRPSNVELARRAVEKDASR